MHVPAVRWLDAHSRTIEGTSRSRRKFRQLLLTLSPKWGVDIRALTFGSEAAKLLMSIRSRDVNESVGR